MPKLNKLHEDLAAKGLVILGIHVPKGSEQMVKFVEDQGIAHPVCVDPEGATSDRYGVEGIPTVVVVDKKGIVRAQGHGMPKVEALEGLLAEE